jgi:hypothetical protein
MMLLIAILLGLILVAMVSSNKDAAAGVGKAVKFAVVGVVMLGAWIVLIGYAIWYGQTYFTSDTERIIGITLPVLWPPFLCWVNRKVIQDRYRKDRKAVLKSTAIFVGSLAATMVAMPAYQEMKKLDNYIGWEILLAALAVTASVLFIRSLAAGKTWRQVWMGLPPLPNQWEILAYERDLAAADAEAYYEAFVGAREKMTDEDFDAYRMESSKRDEAAKARLDALAEQLAAERLERDKNDARLSVAKVFWGALIFSAIGVIVMTWNYALDYAMGLNVVKGRTWLAILLVATAGFMFMGAVVSIVQMVLELVEMVLKRKRSKM